MTSRLQKEIKQTRPFPSVEVEALLNVNRTADQIHRLWQKLLKPYNLTPTQFNILRILRGSMPEGLPCMQIGERLVQMDPDITRLLNRLEKRGLITRERQEQDRRVVTSRITAEGLQLLDALSPEIEHIPVRLLGALSKERIQLLTTLLEEVRCALGKIEVNSLHEE
ncbi:MAG: MarR family winged helix-turn-helix transcriptional regulator [Acidobacteriaceae bacterium]